MTKVNLIKNMIIDQLAQTIQLKIVYFGPALSGKTTSIKALFKHFGIENKVLSIESSIQRTLFFDYGTLSFENQNWQLKMHLYSMASTGQTFKHRAQLKQSAGNFFPTSRPFVASNGQAFTHAPHFVHSSLSITTRPRLNRSAIHETNPNGQTSIQKGRYTRKEPITARITVSFKLRISRSRLKRLNGLI